LQHGLVDAIKDFIEAPHRRRLLENFASLSVLQVAQYVLPLLTVPYLVRVLGPEKFGIVAFATAVIQYPVMLADYGFKYSATRKISVFRADAGRCSVILSSVLFVKVCFLMATLVGLAVLVLWIPKLRAEWIVYTFGFGTVIASVFFLDWFFQGMECMKSITLLSLLGRTVFTVAVFIFIRKESHYLYVPLLNSLGGLGSALLSVWMVSKQFRVRFALPGWQAIREELKDGWHVFLSVTTAKIYVTGMPLILGCFAPYTFVGYYTAAEKIIQAGAGMLEPFTRALYPYIGFRSARSVESALVLIRRIVRIIGPLTFLTSLFTLLLAPQISRVILGDQYAESIPVIRILAFLLFAKGLGHVFLLQTMLNLGHDRAVFRIVLFASVLCIGSSLVLIPLFSYKGAAVAALVPEMAMLLLSAGFVERRYGVLRPRSQA
jgi:polysaccharide transporter, PST family